MPAGSATQALTPSPDIGSPFPFQPAALTRGVLWDESLTSPSPFAPEKSGSPQMSFLSLSPKMRTRW